MDIIRISLLGICGVVLGFFLKGTRTEYVSFITMGIGIIILGLAVDKLDYLFRMIGKIQQILGSFLPGSVKMQDIKQPRHRLNFFVNYLSWF